MRKFLYKEFHEQGTGVLQISFKDERNRDIIPKTAQFQLMKLDRSIINSRTFATGDFTGNTVVLSGADLAIFGDEDTRFRIFAVQITYDSTYGLDLTGNSEVEFVITRLMNMPDIPLYNNNDFGGKLSIIFSHDFDGEIEIKNSYNFDGKIEIS